ncbi:hypothetical protein [Streptomyces sp. NPDC127040]|uniref:hypothetical protein n=1 Tax=Streptomyces sp. NPDC127040 TaxID=3347116 RepID=UPI00364A9557
MPPASDARGPARPLAEIDAAIRAVALAGRARSEEYQQLLLERAEAVRAGVEPAA